MKRIDLQRIKEHGVDFFVTGNGYIRDCLNLKFIPCVHEEETANRGGVILCEDTQDLQRDYSIAKEVFEHVERGTIKFVLIGLSPYIESENNVTPSIAWDIKKDVPILEDYIKLCIDNGAKPVVCVFPVKESIKETYKANVLKRFRNTIKIFVRKYKALFIDLLDVKLIDKFFQDNGHLNSDGSIVFSVLLSERLYLGRIISLKEIYDMSAECFDVLSKHFQEDCKTLTHHIFCKMASDDLNRLSKTMPKETCMDLMARVFSEMTYGYLSTLSRLSKLYRILSAKDYNDLATRIFEISAEKIRHKDKIKVGFVLYDSSTWCGNDLYNFFSQDERFEPTVFLCLRIDEFKENMVIQKEFLYQKEQLKSNGLNVVALDSEDSTVSEQDLIFYLIPYDYRLPKAFQIININVKTLLAYIPYSFEMGKYDASFTPIVRVAWKQFLPSLLTLEIYNKKMATGIPQRVYSGYPKIDVFYKDTAEFKFDWKMARPDAKKIIWAPHHSIGNWSIATATIQWNYQFMYEFAKAHPEISWVVKPHSNLPANAVYKKVFPSASAYEEYMKAWDDLPNAQVYTGAYYQAIFATSDGMIHDCGSFTAEYQYVDKPMIYLTREGSELNELGNIILNASYLVDGKDLDGIAAMIQRVFIEGDDYKSAERKEVFDKYLNYSKANGMLASEFIYKNIIQGIYKE